jgi:hypothetical protein
MLSKICEIEHCNDDATVTDYMGNRICDDCMEIEMIESPDLSPEDFEAI